MVNITYKGENLAKINDTFQTIIDKTALKKYYNDINIKAVKFVFTDEFNAEKFIFVRYDEKIILDKYVDYKYLIIMDSISG